MGTNWRRFARFGLYLSILAMLFSIGWYIVQRQFDLVLQISLGLIVIGLAGYALLDPEHARQLLTGRQARYGSNALVLSLAFIGILAVVNWLAYKNTKRWDLTEGKQYTLAKETIETLGKLTQPVHAVAFFTKQTSSEQAKSLLDQYAYNSNGKFDYEFVDPNANPAAAEQAKITRDGTVVLNMAGQQEPVTTVSEQELTGGLVRLLNPEKRAIYFLTGHGERSPDQGGQESYSTLKTTLESKNYAIATLNLLVQNQIPADAKVIVVAGPKKQLAQSEVDMLSAFQDKGGRVDRDGRTSAAHRFWECTRSAGRLPGTKVGHRGWDGYRGGPDLTTTVCALCGAVWQLADHREAAEPHGAISYRAQHKSADRDDQRCQPGGAGVHRPAIMG